MPHDNDLSSSCQFRLFLLGSLEVHRRDSSGRWQPISREEWSKLRKATRAVLRRLAAAPGRRLSRGRLLDDLWPGQPDEQAEAALANALSSLRGLLGGKEVLDQADSFYMLPAQHVFWIDVDALEDALNQGTQAALEDALSLLERGQYLEGETGRWAHALRGKAEDMRQEIRFRLAESYETQGQYWQAGEQYRALLHELPPDEEALERWLRLLLRQGRRSQAEKIYAQHQNFFETEGYPLTLRLEALLSSHELTRRQFLADGLTLGGGLLTLGAADLSSLLARSGPVDAALLQLFQDRSSEYWQARNESLLLPDDLWHVVESHNQKLLRLLEGSLYPEHRTALLAILSQAAALAGILLYDANQKVQARSWYALSIRAAHEGQHADLEALTGGLLTLSWLARPEQAAQSLQAAQTLPVADRGLRAWLCAIGAEVRSRQHQLAETRALLDQAERLLPNESIWSSITRMDSNQLLGYQGSCLQEVALPGDPQRPATLQEARAVLEQALANPALRLRRRVIYLQDLASVQLGLGELEAVVATLARSLPFLGELGERRVFSRFQAIRAALPDSQATRLLDQFGKMC